MACTVIKVENISKQYRLGQVGTGTISHDLNRWWHYVRGKEDPYLKIGETNDRSIKGESDYVWALKNINFEVNEGEVLGIIGRNGAGKSTLLKILSRTTTPSSGFIKIKGRVASLLEVGTGFHPELTGRENIYLNGAILGMRKEEIKKNFSEIVDFSGVEKYIDTPVKRYSSGMYVRLAFAVAAHLEPEILVVDEVLAVGDMEFQKKCLGKMKDVSNQGRTVLFVSHNMAAVSNLCDKGLFLRNGQLQNYGHINNIIEEYISFGKDHSGEIIEKDIVYTKKSLISHINSIKIISQNEITNSIDIKNEVHIEIEYTINKDDVLVHPSIHLLDNMGTCVLASFTGNSATLVPDDFFGRRLKKGLYISKVTIPPNFLNEKNYRINVYLVTENFDNSTIAEDVIGFSVIDTGEMRKEYTGEWIGQIRPKLNWQTRFLK